MKRPKVFDFASQVQPVLGRSRAAAVAVRNAAWIRRTAIDPAVEAMKRQLSPAELRTTSLATIEQRVLARLHNEGLVQARKVQQTAPSELTALARVLADVDRRVRRYELPDVPAIGKDELAEGLLSGPAIREMRAVSMRLDRQWTSDRFATRTHEERLAALIDAEASGDALTAYVLDQQLAHELPSLKPDPLRGKDDLQRFEQDTARIQGLQNRFKAVEEARLGPDERARLAQWTDEAATITKEFQAASSQLAAVLHRDGGNLHVERDPEVAVA